MSAEEFQGELWGITPMHFLNSTLFYALFFNGLINSNLCIPDKKLEVLLACLSGRNGI